MSSNFHLESLNYIQTALNIKEKYHFSKMKFFVSITETHSNEK